jgi:hypothetical protein
MGRNLVANALETTACRSTRADDDRGVQPRRARGRGLPRAARDVRDRPIREGVVATSVLGDAMYVTTTVEGAIVRAMAPRTRPQLPRVYPSPEDEADIRAGLAELDRGEGRTLTSEEVQRLAETGEWPEWCDSSSCVLAGSVRRRAIVE